MIHCGVDIAKLKFDAMMRNPNPKAKAAFVHHTFDNAPGGYCAFLEWARGIAGNEATAIRVTMEATGVYHRRAASAFHHSGLVVVVANPKRVKQFTQGINLIHKTDKSDSEGLLRYSEYGAGHVWEPPPPEVDALMALLSRLARLEKDYTREGNRDEKAELGDAPAAVRESIARMRAVLDAEKERLEQAMEDHYQRHPALAAERALLRTIPSVGPATSNYLLTLLRSKRFDNARQASAMAGLIPLQRRSGTSVNGATHISREGNGAIRAALYMSAVSSVRYNPVMRDFYARLREKGKTPKQALTALAHKLVRIGFGVLKHGRPFDANWNMEAD